jgi:hypothetical protein
MANNNKEANHLYLGDISSLDPRQKLYLIILFGIGIMLLNRFII